MSGAALLWLAFLLACVSFRQLRSKFSIDNFNAIPGISPTTVNVLIAGFAGLVLYLHRFGRLPRACRVYTCLYARRQQAYPERSHWLDVRARCYSCGLFRGSPRDTQTSSTAAPLYRVPKPGAEQGVEALHFFDAEGKCRAGRLG